MTTPPRGVGGVGHVSTIYVVTAGEYSEYHICGVFDRQEKAEAYIAYQSSRNKYLRTEIEEWTLNATYDEISRGLTLFAVAFADATKGDATAAEHVSADVESESFFAFGSGTGARYTALVWAKDEASALKIANERRVQRLLRAEQEGEQW